MTLPLLMAPFAPFAPILDAVEERVHSLLAPWVNPFDGADLALDGDDLLG